MIVFKTFGTTDIIAILAFIASACSAFYAWYANRLAKTQFERTESRERDVLIGANYLALETASSAIFQYTAEHSGTIDPIRGDVAPEVWGDEAHAEARAILLNLYFQSLNLFEVCARFRRQDQVRPEVFASWIAWFVELLEDRYFRTLWVPELRANYTTDVRDIFDLGVEIYDYSAIGDQRQPAFYAAVAEVMNCPVIAAWPKQIKEVKSWRQLNSSRTFLSAGTSQNP